MIRIGLVDDHAIVRQGLMRILDQDPEVSISFECGSLVELRKAIRSIPVDVLLLDISLPDVSGLEALSELRSDFPNTAVLILSMYPEDQYALRVIKSGAKGYLNKECAPERLLKAVRVVARGKQYITPRVAELLAVQLSRSEQPAHQALSDREFEIFKMIGAGLRLTEIGKMLSISVKTVSTYRTRIFAKMGFRTNADVVRHLTQTLP